MIIMKMRNNSILIRLGSFSQPTQQSLMRAVSDDHNMNMIKDLNLYHFQPGEESRTIRILIISALWHISTALANLLTGYILQVAFAVKFNPWSLSLSSTVSPWGGFFLSLILILCISTPNSWGWWQYLPAAASWPFSMSSSLWRRSAALQYSLMPGMKASIQRPSFYIWLICILILINNGKAWCDDSKTSHQILLCGSKVYIFNENKTICYHLQQYVSIKTHCRRNKEEKFGPGTFSHWKVSLTG